MFNRKLITAALAGGTLTLVSLLSACGGPAIAGEEPSSTETSQTADEPTDSATEDAPADEDTTEDPAAEPGSYDEPFAAGTKLKSDDWEITLSKTSLNANKDIAHENMYNDKPKKGSVYVMTNVAVKHLGSEAASPNYDLTINYVGADGNTYDVTSVVLPHDLSEVNEMHKGARANGNVAFEVPTKDVKGGMFSVSDGVSDEVYVKAV
jgi:hypothetical protein